MMSRGKKRSPARNCAGRTGAPLCINVLFGGAGYAYIMAFGYNYLT